MCACINFKRKKQLRKERKSFYEKEINKRRLYNNINSLYTLYKVAIMRNENGKKIAIISAHPTPI